MDGPSGPYDWMDLRNSFFANEVNFEAFGKFWPRGTVSKRGAESTKRARFGRNERVVSILPPFLTPSPGA